MTTTKITFVHGSLGMGGAEILRISLLEEMVRRNANVRVVVLRQPGELADRAREIGVEVDVLGNRGGLFDLPGVWRLARYLKQHKPRIVQSSQFLTNFHTRLACWLSRVPIHIIEEHGIYKWKRWYHRLIDRLINSHARGVIACSHCVAESAAKNLSIPVEQVHVVPNCVSYQHLAASSLADRDAFRLELAGQETSLLVGIVATLRWEKGHRDLLEAWKMLHANQQILGDACLLIVGQGPLEPELKHQADSIPNVVFLGNRNDTIQILRALDLFILPSVNEGFGIAILEAMAAKVPVIATTSGGIPEIISPDVDGVLVNPGHPEEIADAISRYCQNPAAFQSMAERAYDKVNENFTPQAYVDQLERIYGQLV